jgi:4-hydroxy-4-methyl-2-oxoglutarate aldolase
MLSVRSRHRVGQRLRLLELVAMIGRLKHLDACAISDALDQLGLPLSVIGLHPLSRRGRIAGKVITVKLAAGKQTPAAEIRHLGTTAISRAEPGDVIVIEQRTGIECAGWGGILSNAAKLKGVAGVIVDGMARDIDEAADIGFSIYARGGTARTARGRVHEASTGETIMVGETSVASGDYVVADSSGVAFIPADRLNDVLDAAEIITRKEAAMTKSVLSGRPVIAVMDGDYEHLLEMR